MTLWKWKYASFLKSPYYDVIVTYFKSKLQSEIIKAYMLVKVYIGKVFGFDNI